MCIPVPKRRRAGWVTIDTETTGKDLYHGAKPFFITTCNEEMQFTNFEWEVDPESREPIVDQTDLDRLEDIIANADKLVLQNSPYDVAALGTVRKRIADNWRWGDTYDTLQAGHLIGSNHRHDLYSMVAMWVGKDLSHLEEALKQACIEARKIAAREFPTWRIAKEGLPDMPSAKGGNKDKEQRGEESSDPWKFDMFLPYLIAKAKGYPDDHTWWTVLPDYSSGDSSSAMALIKVQINEIKRRGYWDIYLHKLKDMELKHALESRGVTFSGVRLDEMVKEYTVAVKDLGEKCVGIAAEYGYELKLPKGASPNDNLRDFFFDTLKVEHIYNPKAKTSNPTLNKDAMAHYQATMGPGRPLDFVNTLLRKRSRDTQLAFAANYTKYALPWIPAWEGSVDPLSGAGWYVLHPSLNPTGTDTLRWSSSNPNEQNISKKGIDALCPKCRGDGCTYCHDEGTVSYNMRYALGPAPGREWWSCDGKNLELRLPFYKCGELELIELFERPNDPPYYGSNHLMNFHTIYEDLWNGELGKVCNECCKGKVVDITRIGPHCKKKFADTWYQWCKNGGFAIQYGAVDKIGGTGTADRAFHMPGAHSKLKARFRRLEAFNQQVIAYANRHGYVETFPDKTVDPARGYPLLCTRTERGKILETVPLAYQIQGSAMWWMHKAMVRTYEYMRDLNAQRPINDGYYIALQVHDELVFDFPRGRGPEPWKTNLPKIRQIKRLMEQGGDDYGIPTPVSLEYHAENWKDGLSL